MSQEQIAQIKAAVDKRGIKYSDLGVFNCRKQRGKYADTSVWSQHSWSNAWDFNPTNWSKTAVSIYLRSLPYTRNILVYDDHIHVEGSDRSGQGNTPPCASGQAAGVTGDTGTTGGSFWGDAFSSWASVFIPGYSAMQGSSDTGGISGEVSGAVQRIGEFIVGAILVILGFVLLARELGGPLAQMATKLNPVTGALAGG